MTRESASYVVPPSSWRTHGSNKKLVNAKRKRERGIEDEKEDGEREKERG